MPDPKPPAYPTPDKIINAAPPEPENRMMGGFSGAVRMIELVLAYAPIPHAYTVRSIRNSVWYKPGDWLSADVVKKICENPGWDTTMLEFHIELPNIPIPLPIP